MRETTSVEELIVGGTWRRTRYYTTDDASGRDRDGEDRNRAKSFFVDF